MPIYDTNIPVALAPTTSRLDIKAISIDLDAGTISWTVTDPASGGQLGQRMTEFLSDIMLTQIENVITGKVSDITGADLTRE